MLYIEYGWTSRGGIQMIEGGKWIMSTRSKDISPILPPASAMEKYVLCMDYEEVVVKDMNLVYITRQEN